MRVRARVGLGAVVRADERRRLATRGGGCGQAAAHPLAKEPRRESADELALCSSSKASSSSPPRSWTSACAGGTATRRGKRGCSEPAARTPTPIPVAPGHGRSISVRPMRHGRSHPPSPRPPPALAKPRPRELWRTGAASESSMISDGRSSGPDRKDVGAARTGRSSSSLDESAIGLQRRVGLLQQQKSKTCLSG